jgi:hypothetical protein
VAAATAEPVAAGVPGAASALRGRLTRQNAAASASLVSRANFCRPAAFGS